MTNGLTSIGALMMAVLGALIIAWNHGYDMGRKRGAPREEGE